VASTSISWTEVVTAIASVVVGIGTVGAVLVALFGQSWLERRRAPKLSLQLGLNSDGMEWMETTGPADPVTLRVIADAGKRTAVDVEVLITASWTVASEGGSSVGYVVLDHYPLAWFRAAGLSGSSTRLDGPVTRLNIAPGTVREVELLRIGRPMALYDYLDWPRPPPTAGRPQGGPSAPERFALMHAAAFAVGPCSDELGSEVLLGDHLIFHLRLTLTARDTDTVTYETDLRVVENWDPERPMTVKDSEGGSLGVTLRWTPLLRNDSAR
jgi:hypothetical protein